MRTTLQNLLWTVLVGAALVTAKEKVACAQVNALNESNLIDLIKLGIDETAIVANIQKSGISFAVTDESLSRLKAAGASDVVLSALRKTRKSKVPSAGGAPITYQDVLKLLKLRIDEDTIINRLKKSPTIFTLGAQQVAELKAEGASQKLLDVLAGNRPTSSQSGDVTDFAIILDCSGSMIERTKDGVAKIKSAKTVVTDLVRKIPDGLRLTFIVYGSESKSTQEESCRDIKIVRPLSELDAAGKVEMARIISQLSTHGSTPIASSLKLAGQELLKNDAFCGMVLISDGKETCGGDPAAEAAELAKNPKLSFGVNVIGFDVRDDERQSLERIAQKGKGKYYNADSAAKLEEAVASLRKELESKAKAAPEQRRSREATFSGKVAKPGAFLHDAGRVDAGQYRGSLAMMEAHYYKIPLHKDQELRVIGEIQKSPYGAMNSNNHQTFSVTIYDDGLAAVKRESILVKDTPKSVQTLRATWRAAADGFVYVGIAASDNTDSALLPVHVYPEDFKPKPSPYSLRIRLGEVAGESSAVPAEVPLSTARSGTGFDQAAEMNIPSVANADAKLGEVLYYKVKAGKGQTLRVSLAAQKPWYRANNSRIKASYTLTVYDDDHVQIGQRKIDVDNNPPEAQTANLVSPIKLDGYAFISVSCENSGSDIYPAGFDPKPGYVAVQVTAAKTEKASE